MRHSSKKIILVSSIVFISALLLLGYNSAAKHLRLFASEYFRDNLDAEVSIGQIGLGLPLCLELKDVKIDGSIDLRSIRIYPSLSFFLLKRPSIVSQVRIIDPVIHIGGEGRAQYGVPVFLKMAKRGLSSKTAASGVYFSRIRIYNGAIIYKNDEKNALKVVKIKGIFENPAIHPSKDNNLKFVLEGFIGSGDSDILSTLTISGYIRSDNTIKAGLRAKDIMLNTLASIYPKGLGGAVKEGRIDIDSDIRISSSDLTAKCLVKPAGALKEEGTGQKTDIPLAASFILLVNLKNKSVKLKNINGNFFKLIFNSPFDSGPEAGSNIKR